MSGIPKWHFAMLNDAERNRAFAEAINERVNNKHTVLDIGAGTGLLSVLALASGARSVDAFEADPDIARVARQVLSTHGAREVNLFAIHSTRASLRTTARKNFLLTETFDCAVIGEGILPTLRHARRELLQTAYDALPAEVSLSGRLISAPRLRALNEVSDAVGIKVDPMNRLQTVGHFPVRLHTWPHEFVSDAELLYRLDLHSEPDNTTGLNARFRADRSSYVDGVLAWFDMDLGAGAILTNSPGTDSHWMQAFIPLPAPVYVDQGSEVDFKFRIVDDTKFVADHLGPSHHTAERRHPALATRIFQV
ncbi:hypothetical protein MDOR_11500 [Mycolicibacterium doricum]|uniref:Protein arginine N-methyltransferase domain-containing protein n=1 Tax=Mycolicibacterium doricum TaxID=126673 RepID=A0A1X1TDJ8_9MYCO|nr:50S ribosomal protein L11 methyltransferase [Mycolicibacterium doricum]MCV7266859.1 50S ribosomal protein L11 methyltransferase [Mycolicibacterium doricum]ORV42617.1 hypothetical protein AWC01_07780 [Mycolicibacterium doricum]BBZ06981.1 hypothetical protein MDOR_11500 [Mycolicibacterium doricum]